jgi:hypothetical protein
MIGDGWWATGIIVAWTYAGGGDYGWAATVNYLDGGFVDDVPGTSHISTEGQLRTRYAVRDTQDLASSLPQVIDVILADAARLGITWRDPSLYYMGDGEDDNYVPPGGWRETLGEQSDRIGWQRIYGEQPRLRFTCASTERGRRRPPPRTWSARLR